MNRIGRVCSGVGSYLYRGEGQSGIGSVGECVIGEKEQGKEAISNSTLPYVGG